MQRNKTREGGQANKCGRRQRCAAVSGERGFGADCVRAGAQERAAGGDGRGGAAGAVPGGAVPRHRAPGGVGLVPAALRLQHGRLVRSLSVVIDD